MNLLEEVEDICFENICIDILETVIDVEHAPYAGRPVIRMFKKMREQGELADKMSKFSSTNDVVTHKAIRTAHPDIQQLLFGSTLGRFVYKPVIKELLGDKDTKTKPRFGDSPLLILGRDGDVMFRALKGHQIKHNITAPSVGEINIPRITFDHPDQYSSDIRTNRLPAKNIYGFTSPYNIHPLDVGNIQRRIKDNTVLIDSGFAGTIGRKLAVVLNKPLRMGLLSVERDKQRAFEPNWQQHTPIYQLKHELNTPEAIATLQHFSKRFTPDYYGNNSNDGGSPSKSTFAHNKANREVIMGIEHGFGDSGVQRHQKLASSFTPAIFDYGQNNSDLGKDVNLHNFAHNLLGAYLGSGVITPEQAEPYIGKVPRHILFPWETPNLPLFLF